MSKSLSEIVRELQTMELSGVGHFHDLTEPEPYQHKNELESSECMGLDPFEKKYRELIVESIEIIEMADHYHKRVHKWNGSGFCEFCGWDGNA